MRYNALHTLFWVGQHTPPYISALVMTGCLLQPIQGTVQYNLPCVCSSLERDDPAQFLRKAIPQGRQEKMHECIHCRDPLGEWHSLGNPCIGGSDLENAFTFFSQPTFVMPMPRRPGSFVFMADQWDPEDLSASRSCSSLFAYVMLVSCILNRLCKYK